MARPVSEASERLRSHLRLNRAFWKWRVQPATATLTERAVTRTLTVMNVTLTPALEQFIQRKVGEGGFASADEVIAASLAMMSIGEDAEWKAEARKKIAQGLESARAGRVHAADEVAVWMMEQKAAWQGRDGAK
jgi:putative addiction module CopG family antidote